MQFKKNILLSKKKHRMFPNIAEIYYLCAVFFPIGAQSPGGITKKTHSLNITNKSNGRFFWNRIVRSMHR